MRASFLADQRTLLKSPCSVSTCRPSPSCQSIVSRCAVPALQTSFSTSRGVEILLTSARSNFSQQGRRCSLVVSAAGKELWSPPTVSETKSKFTDAYKQPLPGVYSGVVQELLVQHHLIRYNKSYKYDEVFALGFVSVFDQVLDGLPAGGKEAVFSAYLKALNESPEKFRKDATALEEWAKGLEGPDGLTPNADGDKYQKALASVAESAKAGKFLYSKFFAIGLFRLLELTGAKDPKALEKLVTSLGLTTLAVNRDLMTYKGVLSKLNGAKEMMRETLARERKKVAERDAAKAEAAAEAAAPKSETAEVKA